MIPGSHVVKERIDASGLLNNEREGERERERGRREEREMFGSERKFVREDFGAPD